MPVNDQGVNLNRYMLVPRTLIILTKADSVLLLKGAQNKRLWSGLYNGIGGHVEQGEDILTAAYRELFEETGVTSTELNLTGIVTINTKTNPGVCLFIFTGEFQDNPSVSSTEGLLEWIKWAELPKLPMVEDLPVLLPKIVSFKPGSEIFYAHTEYNKNGEMEIRFA